MPIDFSAGTNSTLISRPPRVITTTDTVAGCPGTKAAGLAQCTTTLVIARPAWVYITGRMIRLFQGRDDFYLVASGPNGWSSTNLRVRLNWTNNVGSNNWDHVHLRYNTYLNTAGTYTFWIRGTSANTWGCGEDWGTLSIMTQEV